MIDREKLFSEERSRRILETAIELAEKGGFSAVRLRDVAEKAGVALGTVYKRFQSKEDMLVAALEMQMEQLETHVITEHIGGEGPVERVVSLLTLFTAWFCSRPKLARAVLRAMSAGEPALSNKIVSFQKRVDAFIVGALRNEDPAPWLDVEEELPVEDDEIQLAHMIQSLWFATMVGWSARLHTEKEVVRQVEEATWMLVLGQEAYLKHKEEMNS